MFGQLSGSLQGFEGFGDLKVPVLSVAIPPSAGPTEQDSPFGSTAPSSNETPMASIVVPASAQPKQGTAPDALGASLQDIDPELGSSYDALLRELGSVPRAK
jgi:hypothetical protein